MQSQATSPKFPSAIDLPDILAAIVTAAPADHREAMMEVLELETSSKLADLVQDVIDSDPTSLAPLLAVAMGDMLAELSGAALVRAINVLDQQVPTTVRAAILDRTAVQRNELAGRS